MKPFELDMPTDGQAKHDAKIQSTQWNVIRALVIRRDLDRCRICGRTEGLQVHHIDYEDFFDPDKLVTLCENCHQAVSDAVKKAGEMEVKVKLPDTFKAGWIESEKVKVGQMMECAVDRAYGELVADTLLAIFKKWLSNGGDTILRRPEALRNAGDIVIRSIEGQTDLRTVYGEVTYLEATIEKIADFTARAYDHYAGEGMSDCELAVALRVPPDKMYKVRRRAERLNTGGGDGKQYMGKD